MAKISKDISIKIMKMIKNIRQRAIAESHCCSPKRMASAEGWCAI